MFDDVAVIEFIDNETIINIWAVIDKMLYFMVY